MPAIVATQTNTGTAHITYRIDNVHNILLQSFCLLSLGSPAITSLIPGPHFCHVYLPVLEVAATEVWTGNWDHRPHYRVLAGTKARSSQIFLHFHSTILILAILDQLPRLFTLYNRTNHPCNNPLTGNLY